jgi:HPt (histidine-containing phosphotransfer) domain-containing protein
MKSDIEFYKQTGMVACLGKPFKTHELWTTLMGIMPPVSMIEIEEHEEVKDEVPDEADDSMINSALGLQRTAGNQDLYKSLLVNFVKNNSGDGEKLRRLYEDGNVTQAFKLAHTLKSVAATVGAAKLSATAGEIESALHEGNKPEAAMVSAEIARLERELAQTVGEIEIILDTKDKDTKSGDEAMEFNKAAAAKLLEELIPLLDTGNSKSISMLDSIDEQFNAPTDVPNGLRELAKLMSAQIDDYDFDTALETADLMMKEIKN